MNQPNQSLDALMMKALYYTEEVFSLSLYGYYGNLSQTNVVEGLLTCFFDASEFRKPYNSFATAPREYYAREIFKHELNSTVAKKLERFFRPGVKMEITRDALIDLGSDKRKAMFSIRLTLPDKEPELLDKIIRQAVRQL